MGCWFSRRAADTKPPPYDFYRAGPLRYMGYAGHIGSACGLLLPPSVAQMPQMAATAYICADIFNKTVASSDRADKHNRVVINALDALIWQILASIVIPGIVFNGIKSTTQQIFVRQTKGGPCGNRPVAFPKTPLLARFIPCILALLAAPLIAAPIDRGVDHIMNKTYRKWTKPTDEELLDPKERARLESLRAKKLENEAKDKAKQAEREARDKALAAERLAKEKAKQIEKAEKEAREKAKQKCKEEAKAWKDQMAAEEKALNEKLKREEAELKIKRDKLAQDLKEKSKKNMACD